MIRILLLEDMGNIWDSFVKREKEIGDIKLYSAFQVSDAMDIFETKQEKIDWYIIDLNVPTIGLTKEETDSTDSGILAGWIWLNNYVYKKNPELMKRTIIFSAHIKELKDLYDNDLSLFEQKGIQFFKKGEQIADDIIKSLKS